MPWSDSPRATPVTDREGKQAWIADRKPARRTRGPSKSTETGILRRELRTPGPIPSRANWTSPLIPKPRLARRHGLALRRTPRLFPAPDETGHFDLVSPYCYLNREITWLNFNFRVLHEAKDPRTPLLERAKFIAIVGSNLDEFFMKRIGGLKQQLGAGLSRLTVDGRGPLEQIEACYEIVRDLEREQCRTRLEIVDLLGSTGIHTRFP